MTEEDPTTKHNAEADSGPVDLGPDVMPLPLDMELNGDMDVIAKDDGEVPAPTEPSQDWDAARRMCAAAAAKHRRRRLKTKLAKSKQGLPHAPGIPLTITMPSSSRKTFDLSSCKGKQEPNRGRTYSQDKFKCPQKSISSTFKVTSVPRSMVFKTTNMEKEGAQVISADGEWRDISVGYQEKEQLEEHETNGASASFGEMDEDIALETCNSVNSNAQFYYLFGNVILHLKHPGSFPFCGQLQVEVVKGAVEILGYTLTPRKGSHIVYSPRGYCILPIQTVVPEEKELCNVSCMDIPASQIASLFETGGEDDAWLYLRKVDSILPAFVDNYLSFKLFPSTEMIEKDRTSMKAAKKLHCAFDIPDGRKCFEKGDEWDFLHTLVLRSGCSVLCGGKGVGKSTMLRFLINQFLSNGEGPVVLLDFDPGQAELTLPGCVSVSIVDRPLLGPNFTHLQKTEKCIYLGEVNVSNCVTRYLDACESLIDFWRSTSACKGMPCIVNTMGFTQGLGVTLMVQLLSLLKPNLVIQIESNVSSRNFPDKLSVDYVKRNSSTSPFVSDVDTQIFTLGVQPVCSNDINYDLFLCKSVAEMTPDKSLNPRLLREVVVLSYLSQAASLPTQSILDVVPYSCPLDKLYLNVCHETVDPSLTLSAINASLVALCNASPCEEEVIQASTAGVPAILNRPVLADCLGFGVVRGIDMDTKYLYLSTPLKPEQLASVNCIILGAVNLPDSVLLNPPRESGPVPYVAVLGSASVASDEAQKVFCLNPVLNELHI